MVVFWQKWLYSGKVVVLGQIGVIGKKWFLSCKSGCVPLNWLYSGKKGLF